MSHVKNKVGFSEGGSSPVEHCLVCHTDTKTAGTTVSNIYSPYCRTTMSNKPIGETLDTTLGESRSQSRSEVICSKCFKLLDLIDSLDIQLRLKRTEVKTLFYNSKQQQRCLSRGDVGCSGPDGPQPSADSQTLQDSSNVSLPTAAAGSGVSSQDRALEPNVEVAQDGKHQLGQPDRQVEDTLHTEGVGIEPEDGTGDPFAPQAGEPPKMAEKGLLSVTDLTCQICGKLFEKRRYLMDHLRRTHKTSVYSCKSCQARFRFREMLLQHQLTCKLYLATSGSTKASRASSEPEKVLTKQKKNNQCPECKTYFLTLAMLERHQVKSHNMKAKPRDQQFFQLEDEVADKDDVRLTCDQCRIVVNNGVALALHMSSVHNCERPWVCKTCQKTFARRMELDNHERTHTGERPFQCDVCGATFNQKSNLRTHVRHTHLGEKRHTCSFCGQTFKRKRLMDCHINAKHTFERPYSCRLCSARFSYPEHVRKHEQSHSKTEKFPCSQCNRVFRSKKSQEIHQQRHKSGSRFICLICQESYLKKAEMLEHMKVSGHPKAIFMDSNDVEKVTLINISNKGETIMESKQEAVTLTFGDEFQEEEVVGLGGRMEDEVVFYLSEQPVQYSEKEPMVYLAQEGRLFATTAPVPGVNTHTSFVDSQS